jgi:hypothetical protein
MLSILFSLIKLKIKAMSKSKSMIDGISVFLTVPEQGVTSAPKGR